MDLKLIWIGSEMGKSGVKAGNTQSSLVWYNSIYNGYELDLKRIRIQSEMQMNWICNGWIGSKTGNIQRSLVWYNGICNGYEFDLIWIWIGYVFEKLSM